MATHRKMPPDSEQLRSYVTAMDGHQWDQVSDDTVVLHVSHQNLRMKLLELRFDLHMTILTVKQKLYTHTGTMPGFQTLVLKSGGTPICVLDNDDKMLGFYGAENGMEIHCLDADPTSLSKNGGLEDVSKVKKFELTDEEYDKRENTIRSYVREQRQLNPDFKLDFNQPKPVRAVETRPIEEVVEESDRLAAAMTVGDRCQVRPGDRRGTVAFLGEVRGLAEGSWVGVKFDEPVAKGNGMRGEVRYFDCEPNFGAFVRPKNVEVGDFPERDIFDELDEESEEEI